MTPASKKWKNHSIVVREVAVAQLVEWSLLTREVRIQSSAKFNTAELVVTVEKTQIKKKRQGMAI